MSYDVYMTVEPGPGIFETRLEIGNMTSNVASMWRKASPGTDGLAGIHGKTGAQVAAQLRAGVTDMLKHQADYEPLAPANGWGSFGGALRYLERITEAAEAHPNATFEVSR